MANSKQPQLELQRVISDLPVSHRHSEPDNQPSASGRSTIVDLNTDADECSQERSMAIDEQETRELRIDHASETGEPSHQVSECLIDVLCRAAMLGVNDTLLDKAIDLCQEIGIYPSSSSCIQDICRSIIESQNGPDRTESISDDLLTAAHATLQNLTSEYRHHAAIESAAKRQFYNFAYGLTHEINNPLANIAARAEQLLRDEPNSRNQKSLATIVDQSFRAHDMLAEVMRIVQPMQLRISSQSVLDWLNHSTDNIAAKCQTQNIDFSIDCDAQLVAMFDRIELAAALNACLENAIEACSPGESISVQAKHSISISSTELLIIEITDTGRGISVQGLKNARDLYFSGRESGRGLGLGVSKAQRIVMAHGGELEIASQPKAYTQVRLSLPITSR